MVLSVRERRCGIICPGEERWSCLPGRGEVVIGVMERRSGLRCQGEERWSCYLTQWNEMQNVLNVCHGYMLICSFCLLQGLQCLSLPCLWFGGDGRFLSFTLECWRRWEVSVCYSRMYPEKCKYRKHNISGILLLHSLNSQ